jgi:hypothetical protein
MRPSQQYEPVDSSDDSTDDKDVYTGDINVASPNRKRKLYFILTGIILAIVGISVVSVLIARKASRTNSQWNHCGGTPAEARRRGCQFDVMIGSWVLPECFDRDLMEEHLLAGNWRWFSDFDLTHEMTLDEVRLGEHHVLAAPLDYHTMHCAYMWKRQAKALISSTPLDEVSLRYHHTLHCIETWDSAGSRGNYTTAHVGYPICKYPTCTYA